MSRCTFEKGGGGKEKSALFQIGGRGGGMSLGEERGDSLVRPKKGRESRGSHSPGGRGEEPKRKGVKKVVLLVGGKKKNEGTRSPSTTIGKKGGGGQTSEGKREGMKKFVFAFLLLGKKERGGVIVYSICRLRREGQKPGKMKDNVC